MSTDGFGNRGVIPLGEEPLAMPEHAFGIRARQRQAREELRGHAAAAALVEQPAARARAGVLRAPQVTEQLRLSPHPREPAGLADVAGEELVVDHERARVHIADRIDQAHHPPRAAKVQSGQRGAVAAEVKERVTGQHILAVGQQPLVQLALLRRGGVKAIPHLSATPGRPQPREPQLRAEPVGQLLESAELGHVLARDHDRKLESSKAGLGQVLHRSDRGRVRPRAADTVVHRSRRPVE